jgi:hypothetical protein
MVKAFPHPQNKIRKEISGRPKGLLKKYFF